MTITLPISEIPEKFRDKMKIPRDLPVSKEVTIFFKFEEEKQAEKLEEEKKTFDSWDGFVKDLKTS